VFIFFGVSGRTKFQIIMKKFLFFMLAAALFCGCDKDDVPCPVTEISIPESSTENPVQPGSSVTIKGKGFTDASEIWLRGTDRAAEVCVEITDVSTVSLTFTAPEVSGEQTVVLKQDGGEWNLGKLYFVELDGILPKKLIKTTLTFKEDIEYTETYTYDYDESGRLSKIDMGEDGGVAEIEYTANEITLRYNDEYEKWQNVFSLKNGHAATFVEENLGDSDICETELFYGDNDYLSGYVCTWTEEGEKNTVEGTLTIGEGGYLKTYSAKETKDIEWDIEFTPNKEVRNNLNLDLMGCIHFIDQFEPAIEYAYLLGIGGKRTTYLPQQLTVTEDNFKYIIKYDYKFNGDYLSEIRMNNDEEQLTMKLYYE